MTTPSTTAVSDRAGSDTAGVPGEPGVWVFLFGDLLIFTALFATYLVYHGLAPEQFAAAQRLLSPDVGLADTLILLLSSLLVALGLLTRRREHSRASAGLVVGAVGCGAAFSISKIVEYGGKLTAGVVPTSSDFWMFYFVTTGLHWFHLLVGMAVLGVVASLLRRPEPLTAGRRAVVEGGACFWHMVDLLWIVIFSLLYLVR